MNLLKQHQPTTKQECKVIKARYDPIKDWRMDKAGYFLIRINPKTNKLEVGLCKKNNVVEVIVEGDNPEDIYNTVVREKITTDPTHIGYLGKELQKAFIARELKIPYVQDDALDVYGFKKIK